MKRTPVQLVAGSIGAILLVAGLTWTAQASSSTGTDRSAAAGSAPKHRDEPLAAAYEKVSQNTTWTLSKTLPSSWIPVGKEYEQEGLKVYRGRIYITVYDHTDSNGHLVVLDQQTGKLIKDISFVDGDRDHAGGLSVDGDYAYVPLAVDKPNTSADILRIDIRTYRVQNLFTVDYDHIGGVTYMPETHHIVGQSWDSRTFYEWTPGGRIVRKWNNPSDYVGYQDCQDVTYDKLLCSGATLGATTIGGFDLIDLGDPEHALLNGVPNVHGGNAAEILATPVEGGTRLTMYNTGSANALTEYTTVIPST